MKKKLLILNQSQFGYHTGTYYICMYLKNHFDITYFCWDYKNVKITLDPIQVKYVSRSGNILKRNIRFIVRAAREVRNKYDICFIKYFRGCSCVKILNPSNKFLFDIRTGSIAKNHFKRLVYNTTMRLESKFFKHITVISKSLAKTLYLNSKAYILPLGADIISSSNKSFDSINLLYIGTLSNRNIGDTITGFSKFYKTYNRKVPITYTIIGKGFNNEEKMLKDIAIKKKVSDAVNITGAIPHNRLKPYFDSCNLGVSYIPVTDYFNVQPATKTFEYLLSGIPVIATDTIENRSVINEENGILIKDNAESFQNALINIYKHRDEYNSTMIRNKALHYSWKNIVNNLRQYLENIVNV